MASEPAMTPAQALTAVASVRAYRERLTGRAAGIVWMVWGFALALMASTELTALAAPEPPAEEGWGVGLDGPAIATMVVALSCLLGGVLATNAVWKAHALERGQRHRAWVTWAAVAGLIAVTAAIGIAVVEVLSRSTDPGPGSTMSQVHLMPLIGAMAAGIIAILQRRHVSPWPGIVTSLLLLCLQFALPLTSDLARASDVVLTVQVTTFAILLGFVATGLWYHKRG